MNRNIKLVDLKSAEKPEKLRVSAIIFYYKWHMETWVREPEQVRIAVKRWVEYGE